jgi:protein-disulfide isomerase
MPRDAPESIDTNTRDTEATGEARYTTDQQTLQAKLPRATRVIVMASLIVSVASAVLSALALLFSTGVLPSAGGAGLENQIRAYLLANPETILQSVTSMEARQKTADENELTAVLAQRHEEVFNDSATPVGDNPNGDATLVEFFDYNCPYCRKAAPMLDELQQADKGLRIVFKEYPILGPGSTFAARAALASQRQGKYAAFHRAMMTNKGAINEGSALEVASQVGLNVEQLKKDMKDPAIDEAIKRNLALAEALHISGTPTFVAGKQIVPGLIDPDRMKRLIADARKG